MLRAALGLMVGIMAAEYVPEPPLKALAVAVGAGVGLLIVTVRERRRWSSALFLAVLWVVLVAVGWLGAAVRVPADPLASVPASPLQPSTLLLQVADTPRPSQRCWKVSAEVMAVRHGGGWTSARGQAMLFIQKDSAAGLLRYGDRLVACGRFETPTYRNGTFDYGRYLRHHGIRRQCYLATGTWQFLGRGSVPPLLRWAKETQRRLVERIRSTSLPPNQQGVVEALVLGWKDDVGDDLRAQFQGAGVAHLLAVSGLHVGIVAFLAGAGLSFLGRRRWERLLKGVFQLAAIWLFAAVSGFAPSTVRAALMFSLVLVGDMLFLHASRLNHLATAAVLTLTLSPWTLFDVSFQLSYSAVLGIFVFYPRFSEWLPRAWRAGWRRPLSAGCDLLCLSLAAQLSMLPFMLYHFHQFPVYFLVANLVVMPFAALLLASALLLLTAAGWAAVAPFAVLLVRWELLLLEKFLTWVSSWPGALVSDITFGYGAAVLLAAALVSLAACLWEGHTPRRGSESEAKYAPPHTKDSETAFTAYDD